MTGRVCGRPGATGSCNLRPGHAGACRRASRAHAACIADALAYRRPVAGDAWRSCAGYDAEVLQVEVGRALMKYLAAKPGRPVGTEVWVETRLMRGSSSSRWRLVRAVDEAASAAATGKA